jgi:hypothetical protein
MAVEEEAARLAPGSAPSFLTTIFLSETLVTGLAVGTIRAVQVPLEVAAAVAALVAAAKSENLSRSA